MQFSTSKNAASDLILTDARKALALGWRRKEEGGLGRGGDSFIVVCECRVSSGGWNLRRLGNRFWGNLLNGRVVS